MRIGFNWVVTGKHGKIVHGHHVIFFTDVMDVFSGRHGNFDFWGASWFKNVMENCFNGHPGKFFHDVRQKQIFHCK